MRFLILAASLALAAADGTGGDHHHHHDHDDHQIYKCLNFFVSQPILFIFGHMIGMGMARVVMEPDF